jgi:hypothetical protein
MTDYEIMHDIIVQAPTANPSQPTSEALPTSLDTRVAPLGLAYYWNPLYQVGESFTGQSKLNDVLRQRKTEMLDPITKQVRMLFQRNNKDMLLQSYVNAVSLSSDVLRQRTQFVLDELKRLYPQIKDDKTFPKAFLTATQNLLGKKDQQFVKQMQKVVDELKAIRKQHEDESKKDEEIKQLQKRIAEMTSVLQTMAKSGLAAAPLPIPKPDATAEDMDDEDPDNGTDIPRVAKRIQASLDEFEAKPLVDATVFTKLLGQNNTADALRKYIDERETQLKHDREKLRKEWDTKYKEMKDLFEKLNQLSDDEKKKYLEGLKFQYAQSKQDQEERFKEKLAEAEKKKQDELKKLRDEKDKESEKAKRQHLLLTERWNRLRGAYEEVVQWVTKDYLVTVPSAKAKSVDNAIRDVESTIRRVQAQREQPGRTDIKVSNPNAMAADTLSGENTPSSVVSIGSARSMESLVVKQPSRPFERLSLSANRSQSAMGAAPSPTAASASSGFPSPTLLPRFTPTAASTQAGASELGQRQSLLNDTVDAIMGQTVPPPMALPSPASFNPDATPLPVPRPATQGDHGPWTGARFGSTGFRRFTPKRENSTIFNLEMEELDQAWRIGTNEEKQGIALVTVDSLLDQLSVEVDKLRSEVLRPWLSATQLAKFFEDSKQDIERIQDEVRDFFKQTREKFNEDLLRLKFKVDASANEVKGAKKRAEDWVKTKQQEIKQAEQSISEELKRLTFLDSVRAVLQRAGYDAQTDERIAEQVKDLANNLKDQRDQLNVIKQAMNKGADTTNDVNFVKTIRESHDKYLGLIEDMRDIIQKANAQLATSTTPPDQIIERAKDWMKGYASVAAVQGATRPSAAEVKSALSTLVGPSIPRPIASSSSALPLPATAATGRKEVAMSILAHKGQGRSVYQHALRFARLVAGHMDQTTGLDALVQAVCLELDAITSVLEQVELEQLRAQEQSKEATRAALAIVMANNPGPTASQSIEKAARMIQSGAEQRMREFDDQVSKKRTPLQDMLHLIYTPHGVAGVVAAWNLVSREPGFRGATLLDMLMTSHANPVASLFARTCALGIRVNTSKASGVVMCLRV